MYVCWPFAAGQHGKDYPVARLQLGWESASERYAAGSSGGNVTDSRRQGAAGLPVVRPAPFARASWPCSISWGPALDCQRCRPYAPPCRDARCRISCDGIEGSGSGTRNA